MVIVAWPVALPIRASLAVVGGGALLGLRRWEAASESNHRLVVHFEAFIGTWSAVVLASLLGLYVALLLLWMAVREFTRSDGSPLVGAVLVVVALLVPMSAELARRQALRRGERGTVLVRRVALTALFVCLGVAFALLVLSAPF